MVIDALIHQLTIGSQAILSTGVAKPKPDEAAVIVADAIQKVTEYESGSFLDVREL